MSRDRTTQVSGNAVPGDDVADGTVPSAQARARLSDALRDRADAYRQDATVDLTILEALLKLDEPEAAAKTLEDHRASLHAMARDLQVAVADAAVEREAERVWQACARQMTAPEATPTPLRRRVLTMASAAAVALVLFVPVARFSPRAVLASFDHSAGDNEASAARERLVAAQTWARALRAEQAAAAEAAEFSSARSVVRQHVVRNKVRAILAADDPGGSAATTRTPMATVTDLDGYRVRRSAGASQVATGAASPAGRTGEGGGTHNDDDSDLPVADVHKRVPAPQDPLKAIGRTAAAEADEVEAIVEDHLRNATEADLQP